MEGGVRRASHNWDSSFSGSLHLSEELLRLMYAAFVLVLQVNQTGEGHIGVKS